MAETKLNYEEASKALDRVMEKTGKKAKDIDKNEILEELRIAEITASNSTSGPILRSVLDDADLAESFSLEDIQSFLLAAFIKDRKSAIERAVERMRRRTKKDAEKHGQTLDKLEQALALSQGLENQLLKEQARNLELVTKLATTEGKLSLSEDNCRDLSSKLDEVREELAVKSAEVAQMKTSLEKAEMIQEKLSKAEEQTSEANQRYQLSDHELKSAEERIDELTARNHALEVEKKELDNELKDVRKKQLELTAKNADATARLEERSKQSSNQDSNGQGSGTSNSTTRSRGKGRSKTNGSDDAKTGT